MTTFPQIHLNGTSSNVLLKGYRKALIAVTDAIAELTAVEFNARDYQDHADTPSAGIGILWFNALQERQEQFRQLHAVKRDLEAVVYHLQNGGDTT